MRPIKGCGVSGCGKWKFGGTALSKVKIEQLKWKLEVKLYIFLHICSQYCTEMRLLSMVLSGGSRIWRKDGLDCQSENIIHGSCTHN